MIKIQEDLLDIYANEMSVAASSYEMMGMLLDVDYIRRRIELLNVDEIYLYGGGYLGIQFYRMAGQLIYIRAVVDKKGKLRIDTPNIPVIDMDEFRRMYNGQKVIISSVRFYNEIKKDISSFVPERQMIFLGEFLGGLLR